MTKADKLLPVSGNRCDHPNYPEYLLAKENCDDGVRLYNLGKTTEALEQYRNALEAYPPLQSARYNIAMIMLEWNRLEEAIEEFSKVKYLMSSNHECTCVDKAIFHTNYGVALYHAKQPEKAISEIVMAIELNPNIPEPYLCAGNICFENSMFDKCLFYYEKYSEFRHYDELARVRMGAAYEVVGLFDKAIESFQIVCSLNNSAYNQHMLGVLYYKNNDIESAMASYEASIKIDNSYYEAYYSIANVMRDKELFDEAIINYKKLLSLDKNIGKAHCNLGYVYKCLNMKDEAIAEFNEAIRCDNKDMIAIRSLAEVFAG